MSQPRRTRILPPSQLDLEEVKRQQSKQRTLANRCRPLFERLRPNLIETHYNCNQAKTSQNILCKKPRKTDR